MKLSATIFLALVLAGLSTYYFAWERPSGNLGAELPSLRILSLAEGDSVSWLEIGNAISKEKFSLRKEGSAWALESPVSYPAEKFLVEGIVSALTLGYRLRRFPGAVGAAPASPLLSELGFDAPAIRVSVGTEKGSERRTLIIGEDSPVGSGAYAQWEGEDEYFVIPPEVKASLERTVYSLRQKKIFRFDWDDVTWMAVKVGKKEFRVEKEGKAWHWVRPPLQGEISGETVRDFIYGFQSLYVKEFFDGKNAASLEFDLKSSSSFVAAGTHAGTSEKLILGASVREKEGSYAVREKENLLLLVSDRNVRTLLEIFEITFEEMRSGHSGKSPGDSGTDLEGLREDGEKSR